MAATVTRQSLVFNKGAFCFATVDLTEDCPGANIVVVQLLPLNHGEAMSILDAVGEADPDAFLAKAVSLGAAGFVETPSA